MKKIGKKDEKKMKKRLAGGHESTTHTLTSFSFADSLKFHSTPLYS
jgi:hypothetical protein